MNNDEFSERINIDDLYERKNKLEEHRIKIYQKILNRVHKKIKLTSRQRVSEQFCWFIVPEFMIGLPQFDSSACTAYVIDKLTDNGFLVKYTHPNMLFISWAHYIDKKQRLLFKKENGYAIDAFGQPVKSKKDKNKKINFDDPSSLNSLLLDKPNLKEVKKKKNYKDTSSYQPTGGLIYNNSFLKKIEDGLKEN